MTNENKRYGALTKKGDAMHPASDYIKTRFNSSKRMIRLNKSEKSFVTDVLNNIHDKSGMVIDVPCGTGRLSEVLSEQGSRNYLGIDVADKMLNVAKESHPNLKYISGNVLNLPVNDGEATIVLCMRLLHHVADSNERIEILQELSRASSKFVLVSFYRKGCFRNISKKIRGKEIKGQPISVKQFLAEAKIAGLSKTKIIYNWLAAGAQTLVVLEKMGNKRKASLCL